MIRVSFCGPNARAFAGARARARPRVRARRHRTSTVDDLHRVVSSLSSSISHSPTRSSCSATDNGRPRSGAQREREWRGERRRPLPLGRSGRESRSGSRRRPQPELLRAYRTRRPASAPRPQREQRDGCRPLLKRMVLPNGRRRPTCGCAVLRRLARNPRCGGGPGRLGAAQAEELVDLDGLRLALQLRRPQ
jgi:hypothetical protein